MSLETIQEISPRLTIMSEGQNQYVNINQEINSGVFTHGNTIGSKHITEQSGTMILASPGNGSIPTSIANNVGQGNTKAISTQARAKRATTSIPTRAVPRPKI